MQYNKNISGQYEPLAQKNVDTGLGLERVLAALNGLSDNYQTELFSGLIAKIEELSRQKYNSTPEITKMMRIVADHLKAATFIIGDNKGISPSNTDQGYIVRRLVRRAIRYGRQLGIKNETWIAAIAQLVIDNYADVYGELKRNQSFILEQFNKEEAKFNRTLENGLKKFAKLTPQDGMVSGLDAFNLFQSYGFPLEMTEELAQENNWRVDRVVFEAKLKKHQDLSRTASAGKFKGGLADSGVETTKLHTTAHLLLAALRKVLGDHVVQKGSNITPERLRLDFSHPDKMTPEQVKTVEDMVNVEIQKSLPVVCEQMPLSEAKARGAMGVFDSKYAEEVKVYKIGESDQVFSYEICGGPHVENISTLGHFKILKEESSSSGVRRIKAVLE